VRLLDLQKRKAEISQYTFLFIQIQTKMVETKVLIDSDDTNKNIIVDEIHLSQLEMSSNFDVASPLAQNNSITTQKPYESLPKNQTSSTNEDDDNREKEQMVGAGVTAGVVSLMLGPIIAIAVGFGVAYGTKSAGATGDICRAIGDIGLSVRDKANHLNEKHELVEKTKVHANNVTEKVKSAEERHHLFESLKIAVANTWESLCNFERNYHLLRRSKENIGQALSFVGDKMKTETNQKE